MEEATTDPRAEIGGNNPPLPERLAMDYAEDLQRAQELLDAVDRLPATVEVGDNPTLAKLSTFVLQCRDRAAPLEEARKAEKKVFDDQGKAVQAFFTPTLNGLDAAKARATRIISDHNRRKAEIEENARREAAQREREEADRRAEVAREHEARGNTAAANQLMEHAVQGADMADRLEASANAGTADLARTRLAGGGLVTGKTVWAFEIEDNDLVRKNMGVLGDYLQIEAIEKALRAYLNMCKTTGRDPAIEGVRFFKEHKAIVR